MKTTAEYLDDAWQPAPEEWPKSGIPHVPQAQAERALALQALDAEKAVTRTATYHQNLARAIRNSKAPQV